MKTYSIVPRLFTHIKSEKAMVSNSNGLLVPFKTNDTTEGRWMAPEEARLYIRKGVTLKTFMDYYVYGGRLKDRIRNDVFGWWIFIPYTAIERRNRIINKQAA